jgi:hypothetical protein
MDANEGVQSFNFEVGKKLSHLRNLRANLNITKMQNLYKCTEGVVGTVQSVKLMFIFMHP